MSVDEEFKNLKSQFATSSWGGTFIDVGKIRIFAISLSLIFYHGGTEDLIGEIVSNEPVSKN